MKNSFVDCCYVLYLWVSDAAIRHTFDGLGANDASGSTYWMNYAFVTFGAAP